MIDICVCTHNPDDLIFNRVIRAIADQTLSAENYRVVIVDNLSTPALTLENKNIKLLKEKGLQVSLFREENLGIAHARIRALRESDAENVVFVDDDNVIANNFLEVASWVLSTNPEVGCFSGKIHIPEDLPIPHWVKPLRASLAIRDEGENPIVDWFDGENWAEWVPACTASMVLRRKVIDSFLENHASRPEFYKFGRKGRWNLMSGEDFIIALCAYGVGMKCGYFPELKMCHFIRPSRFSVNYLSRLMASYAVTDLKRDHYLGQPPRSFNKSELKYRLLLKNYPGKDLRTKYCYWLYQAIYVTGKSVQLLSRGQPIVKKV